MDSRFLNIASNDKFRALAYAEYVHDCNENYANFIACLTDITSDMPEDEDENTEVRNLRQRSGSVSDYIQAKLAEYGLSGTMSIALDHGYTTLTDLATSLYTNIGNYADFIPGQDWLNDELLQLNDSVGNAKEGVKASAIDILSQVKEHYHSSVVLEAALSSSQFDDAVSRLSYFKDVIESKFSNVYSDLSNSVDYFKSIIANGALKSRDVITGLFNSLGVNKLATDDDSTLADQDVHAYTGTNPVAVLDFSSAIKLATSTAKVVATAVSTVVKAVTNLAKRVFNWAYNKVKNVFVPYDMSVINEKADSYTVDGWDIQQIWFDPDYDYCRLNVNNLSITDPQTIELWQDVRKFKDHWMKYDFIFGELLFKNEGFGASGTSTRLYLLDAYNPITKLKLRPISRYAVANAFESMFKTNYPQSAVSPSTFVGCDVTNSVTTNVPFSMQIGKPFDDGSGVNTYLTANDICDWLALIPEQPGYLIDIEDDNEKELYYGFLTSWIMLNAVLGWTSVEGVYQGEGYWGGNGLPSDFIDLDTNYKMVPPDNTRWKIDSGLGLIWIDPRVIPAQITNRDFLNVLSGYQQSGYVDYEFSARNIGQFTSTQFSGCVKGLDDEGVYVDHDTPCANPWYRILIQPWVIFISQRADRLARPFNYAFIAYSNNANTFSESRFALKTDSTNQNALTKFLTAAVIVAIVAITAVTALCVVKKIKMARYFKKATFVGTIDQDMWAGRIPSYGDMRKYVRYSRRLNASNLLTSGLQDTASTSVSSLFAGAAAPDSNIEHMISLISGYTNTI